MDASVVSTWEQVCQPLSSAFTQPTFVTFLHIATGWVLCRCRPCVTNIVCTIGAKLLGHAAKHWTSYERFFYRAAWDLEQVCALLLGRIIAPLILHHTGQAIIDLNVDDTTASRRGKHVAFAGYYRDASAGNTLKKVVHWSHNWIIAAVVLRHRAIAHWLISFPILFALYRKRPDCDRQHPFATRQELAAALIRQTHQIMPGWQIRLAADGQYATRLVARSALESSGLLISRIKSDAALYALPPKPRRKRKRGGQRRKRRRLATPTTMAKRRKNGWHSVSVTIYGRQVTRRVLSVVCLWWYVTKDQPIKLLIVRDPAGKDKDQHLFCTDPTVSDQQIIERFAARWPIEESIHDAKQFDGFEQVQGWCPRTVTRQAPLAMVIQSLVKVWYLQHGVRARAAQPKEALTCPWRPPKTHPSYQDMLATLRRVLWSQRFNLKSALRRPLDKILRPLHFTLCAAA